jgi:type I restriction enzyme S subunit
MKNAGKKEMLIPKLRFPEFRDWPGWEPQILARMTDLISGMHLLPDQYGSTGTIPYFTGPSDFTDTLGAVTKWAKQVANLAEVGDTLITVKGSGVGEIWYLTLPSVALGRQLMAVRTKHGSSRFMFQFLLTKRTRFEDLASGNLIPGLSRPDILDLEATFPSPQEQDRIAECLSSLDELMGAERQKLDALKAHRKGLMQQLFPREDETIPRLRFPEFQNLGEWVKKPFSELCDIKHGYAFEGEFFSDEGAYVLLTPGNFYEDGGYRDRGEKQKYYTGEIPREYVLNSGHLLVAMTEQAIGLLGSPILVPESDKFLHNQRLGLVTKKPGIAWTNDFFFHVFNSRPVRKAIQASASGTKVRHTSPIKIGEVVVSVPDSLPEQHRIATCLSSFDDLIAAQSDWLAALQTHKQGLMQRLFPSAAGTDT